MPNLSATGPNPLPPINMTPHERRGELCRLLATGLIRLQMREDSELSGDNREFRLHNSLDQSGTAEPQLRRPA